MMKTQLIWELRSPDDKIVRHAVDMLRESGWLQDGSLECIDLRFSHLREADLSGADLSRANLSMANLQGVNLSNAHLEHARLVGADLRQANLFRANLDGALMVRTNLQNAINLTDQQLARAIRLRGAKMPDGCLYDGRFFLEGDCADARLLHIDLTDPKVFVEFFGVMMELIHQLQHPENRCALEAVDELQRRGWLSDGSLRGISLCQAHLQGANFRDADLSKVDFHQANLESADLSHAKLCDAKLTRASLRGANLWQADLSGADLFKADLVGAIRLTQEQLCTANRLFGAILPDGNLYDGKYDLPGDLEHARWAKVDLTNSQAKAEFYGVSPDILLKQQY